MKYVIRLDRSGRIAMEFLYPDPGPVPPLVPGESATAPGPGKSTRGPQRMKRGRAGRAGGTAPLAPRKH